jgi:hypothetical protein
MTFFLREGKPTPFQARGPDMQPQSWAAAAGAGFRSAQLETDTNFRVRSETRGERLDLYRQSIGLVGRESVFGELSKTGLPEEIIDTMKGMSDEALAGSDEVVRITLELARDAAKREPDQWKGIDLSDEGVDARINKKMQDEHRAAQQVISMTPGAAGTVAPFVGGMAGIMADIRNAPTFFIPLSGASPMRRIASAAVTNAAIEGVFLPSQFEMAERLQIPDPDVLETLLFAAGAGAAFQGAFEGGAALLRGLAHAQGRNAPMDIPGADPATQQMAADAAEDAMVRGDDPVEAIAKVLEAANPGKTPDEILADLNAARQGALAQEAPNPRDEPLVPVAREPVQSNDGQITQSPDLEPESTPSAPVERTADQETTAAPEIDAATAVRVQNWFAENYPGSTVEDFAPSAGERAAREKVIRAEAVYTQQFAVRPDERGLPHRRTRPTEWGSYDVDAARNSDDPAERAAAQAFLDADLELQQKYVSRRTDKDNGLIYGLVERFPEHEAAIRRDAHGFLSAALNDDRVPRIEEKFRPSSRQAGGQPPEPEQQAVLDEIDQAASKIEKEVFGGKRGKTLRYPFLDRLKKAGIRFNPDTPEGQELYGVFGGPREANRTMPGLFSRKPSDRAQGTPSLDNMITSE